jgi:hypothetical protein
VDYRGRANLPGGIDDEFRHFISPWGGFVRRWRRASQQNGPWLNERRFELRRVWCFARGTITNDGRSADRIVNLRVMPAMKLWARVIKVMQDSALVNG